MNTVYETIMPGWDLEASDHRARDAAHLVTLLIRPVHRPSMATGIKRIFHPSSPHHLDHPPSDPVNLWEFGVI